MNKQVLDPEIQSHFVSRMEVRVREFAQILVDVRYIWWNLACL